MADASTGRDYRETLFLPDTSFPMKAGLPQREPEWIKSWAETDLYTQLRKDGENRRKFTLHDGPPYANGAIHIGHAENKILKDIIVRYRQMTGWDADYVPGWDCHGLPIEWKVEEDFRAQGRKKQDVDPVEFRKACRAYAGKWIPLQMEEFKRLGVIGDWDHHYTTMSFEAEAAIAAEFHRVMRTGLVYRGSKPVMWSPVERTSLAEAEVEYQDKTSPAIWVKFPVVAEKRRETDLSVAEAAALMEGSTADAAAELSLVGASVVIWTTTPWTIPGNRAISYSPQIAYGVYEVDEIEEGLEFQPWARVGEKLLIADKLAESVRLAAKIKSLRRLYDVGPLSGISCAHPFRNWNADGYQFDVPLLWGDHVTDDAGTGFVHTAPGHGQDDFEVWLAHGKSQKDIPLTVDEDGRLTKEAPGFEGLEILQLEGKGIGKDGPANKAVMDALIAAGNLLARGQVKHSYPHSWRSKAPLIFRATPQWFIAMDKPYDVGGGKTLREVALGEIERVDWVTEQAKNRIHGMIKDRPDWLISRQRNWGVPLAMFVRKSDGQILIDDEVDGRIVAAMKKGGADVWWETPALQFLGSKYKTEEYEKIEDILDVWFDSGSTHAFVLETRPTLKRPASLYLEGSDQHRGWFHSSLLECCATRGMAPYDAVLTHGFAVDEQGRKMSKSVGNTIEPQKIAKENGIEILRLLIAAAEYGDDLRMGKVILDQASETYRKLRNTMRYLLGALKDYDAARERPEAELPLLERWLLHRLAAVDEVVRQGYDGYQFRAALTAIVEFCNVDLSAFYVDVRKDSLYCDAPSSARRRACRSALNLVFERLTAWLAPIMPFTTEEAWTTRFPGGSSVHLRQFPVTPNAWRDEDAAYAMNKLRAARSVVTGALEEKRRAKEIGSALEAAPKVFVADADLRGLLQSVDFAELCITSTAVIEAGDGPEDAFRLPEVAGVAVQFEPAPGVKCARSWKYFDPATADPRFPDITARDAQAVMEWDASRA